MCTPRARSSQIKSNQIKVKNQINLKRSTQIISNQIKSGGPWTAPVPDYLPSNLLNANYDVRGTRRNRPQREQMPDSSVQCMWFSKSQVTTSHVCPEHVCALCNGELEELPKGHNCAHNHSICQTCKLLGHVAKDRGYVWTSTSIGLTFCSQNPKAPCNNGRAAASTTHRSRNCALKTGGYIAPPECSSSTHRHLESR